MIYGIYHKNTMECWHSFYASNRKNAFEEIFRYASKMINPLFFHRFEVWDSKGKKENLETFTFE